MFICAFDNRFGLCYSNTQSGIVTPGDPDRSENGIGRAEMRERGRAAEMRARQTEIGVQGEPLFLI
jgi:hypothetical protein